jgi:hypothetical protein
MKSILITLILSILMNLAPTVEHGTETSTPVELLSNNSMESHAGMAHEASDDECCHDNCICCVSSSCAMPASLGTEKIAISFVISFNVPETNNPHLDIYLRPPILS